MDTWKKRRDESSSKKEADQRSEWDRDFARVLHSASFRSLQGKPQILNLGDSDYYRTRLTHSLEVVQLSTSVLRQLGDTSKFPTLPLPELTLLQTICFVHDLGHPPFGHGGEVALNFCMRDHGGFEGNGQTLRILSKLENFSKKDGANLTRRALLGILKYPIKYSEAKCKDISPSLRGKHTKNNKIEQAATEGSQTGVAQDNQKPIANDKPTENQYVLELIDRETSKPPKCYLDSEQDVVEWLLSHVDQADKHKFVEPAPPKPGKHIKAQHKSFDCSIMDLSDDLAYGVHDLEDAIVLGLLNRRQFEEYSMKDTDGSLKKSDSFMEGFLDWLKENYPDKFSNNVHSEFLDLLFHPDHFKRQINRIVGYFTENLRVEEYGFKEPLLNYRVHFTAMAQRFIDFLKEIVREKVILSPAVQHLEFKGQRAVVSVFEVFASEPSRFLPPDVYSLFKMDGEDPRRICDYIAGMTDATLLKIYDRLFSPRMGSVFDRL